MEEADLNGDGRLDKEEAVEFLVVDRKLHINEFSRVKRSTELPPWFVAIDTNANGFIEPLELDRDYYGNYTVPSRP